MSSEGESDVVILPTGQRLEGVRFWHRGRMEAERQRLFEGQQPYTWVADEGAFLLFVPEDELEVTREAAQLQPTDLVSNGGLLELDPAHTTIGPDKHMILGYLMCFDPQGVWDAIWGVSRSPPIRRHVTTRFMTPRW